MIIDKETSNVYVLECAFLPVRVCTFVRAVSFRRCIVLNFID